MFGYSIVLIILEMLINRLLMVSVSWLMAQGSWLKAVAHGQERPGPRHRRAGPGLFGTVKLSEKVKYYLLRFRSSEIKKS